jgi:phosphoribosylformimino-5-aminoimidazole carboxamide ribotide isomerase
MIPIPAIDIKNGKCVRLKQGDFNQETVFSENPIETAKKWQSQGAQRLHIVDLDGALDGKATNIVLIANMIQAVNIPVQVGGGIRSVEAIGEYVDIGVEQVILGTKAITDPEFVGLACSLFPQKIIIGLDAKNGKVATNGWLDTGSQDVIELAKKLEKHPIFSIIYTDIAKDGMMQGVNLEYTKELMDAVNIPIVASGGVSCIEDIKKLIELGDGLFGAITGRAIYDGKLDLAEAIRLCKASKNK